MGDVIGISQVSMSRCVVNVIEVFVERVLQFIYFLVDEFFMQVLKDEFYELVGMLGVIGVVDCIYVVIKVLNVEDFFYVNRKGLYFLNCLMVCDIRGVLMIVEINWSGSFQDYVVLQQFFFSSQFEVGMYKDNWLFGKLVEVNVLFYSYRKIMQYSRM